MDVSGLGLKAYLIQEVAAGSAGNAYAPFYVWTDPDALAASTGKGRDSAESAATLGDPQYRRGSEDASTAAHATNRRPPSPRRRCWPLYW
jgi:hypothetical protein